MNRPPRTTRPRSHHLPSPPLEVHSFGIPGVPPPISDSEIPSLLPLFPEMLQLHVAHCWLCRRTLYGVDTIFRSTNPHYHAHTICFHCALAIILEYAPTHADRVNRIPAHGGGPRR